MENCNCHNETILKGSGQLERYLKALDPAYVSIDGRSIEDLLVFAAGYAEQIRFYDMPDSELPDLNKASWSEFFKRDMAVIAASIATVDLEQIKNDYNDASNQILSNPTVELYTALFTQIAAIAIKIDQWYSIAIPENPLHTDINLAINSSLSAELKKAVAYEEGFIVVDSKTVLNIDYTKILNQDEWGLNDKIDPEFDIYEGITPQDRILNAVPYVDDVFHAFFSVISNIVDQSTSYIDFALTQYPAHQPYMALFIAFLKIFNLAQQQMNGLTGKMLDFYYRDVLRLEEKPSVPDKAFVVFELAKTAAEYDLPQGTSLSAGKDASGKDQVYKTENDFVINQASVKELKNIFILKSPADAAEEQKEIGVIYANPVANSKDGYGAKFTVPNPKWPTFDNGILNRPQVKNICEFIDKKEIELSTKNTATVGFAIASPQLFLQGGNRLIGIKMAGFADLFGGEDPFGNMAIGFTGEKGWFNVARQITAKAEIDLIEMVIKTGVFDAGLTTSGFAFNEKEEILFIFLPISEQGVIGFNAKTHTDHIYNTVSPVMQLLIGPGIEISADVYKGLNLDRLLLYVQVGSINTPVDNTSETGAVATPEPNFDGLKTLIIQTDTGAVTPGKAFDPFTTLPSPGKAFYVGSDEVFNKPLGTLTVNIEKTQPDNFRQSSGLKQSSEFINQDATSDYEYDYGVSVLYRKGWRPLKDYEGVDFTLETLTYNILNEVQIDPESKDRKVVDVSLSRTPVEYFNDLNIRSDKGFIRIDNLRYDNGDVQGRLNNAPFFQIKQISLSYQSELLKLTSGIDQFFHVYPFGTVETSLTVKRPVESKPIGNRADKELLEKSIANEILVGGISRIDKPVIVPIDPLIVNANGALLPQFTYLNPDLKYQDGLVKKVADNSAYVDPDKKFPHLSGDRRLNQLILDASGLNEEINGGNNQYSAEIQEEGMLFIGVQNLQPLQTLSLLFQFADGSAIDEDNDPPAINWSYLIYNEWRPLKVENVVSDSTYGFQTTGIVELDVPGDINSKHTIITDGLYWFCASVTTGSKCIPQLIDVVAQATEVQFYDQGNSQLHFDNPLPAGTINKLSVAVAEVSKVQQPFASFDGKHKEVGKEYYTRVSERLRHKGRAVTSWDYEHLVLDRFPNVFKVKCITNTDPGCICRKPVTHREKLGKIKCCGPVSTTGNVLIVPVPNLKNDNAANPLQPKTSRLTLIEIVNYLSPLTSPFVKVHARNPVYEQVIVFFRVKFLSGIDKGYYLKKLNDEIVQYLTPWAFDQTIEADFGQKIYASAVINFIEQRPYVDFITDFLMGVCRNECCPPKQHNAKKITGKDFVAALDTVSGCNDIEVFLKDQGYFIGDVIAKPSSQMSLLVSAPKHIILLYEDPTELTPCEKRLLSKKKLPTVTLHPIDGGYAISEAPRPAGGTIEPTNPGQVAVTEAPKPTDIAVIATAPGQIAVTKAPKPTDVAVVATDPGKVAITEAPRPAGDTVVAAKPGNIAVTGDKITKTQEQTGDALLAATPDNAAVTDVAVNKTADEKATVENTTAVAKTQDSKVIAAVVEDKAIAAQAPEERTIETGALASKATVAETKTVKTADVAAVPENAADQTTPAAPAKGTTDLVEKAPDKAADVARIADTKPTAGAAAVDNTAETPVADDRSEVEKITDKIEEGIEEFDNILKGQTNKFTTKSKAVVKKAEDFFKNVVKGKSADEAPNTDPAAGGEAKKANNPDPDNKTT